MEDDLGAGGRVPKRVVSDSEASRNSLVWMAFSLAASTGTSTKDFWMVSKKVMVAVWLVGFAIGADVNGVEDGKRQERSSSS